MKQVHQDLQGRLAALRTRFAEVGVRAAAAAGTVRATEPPPEALLDDLASTRREFSALRRAVAEQAAGVAGAPSAESLTRLRDVERLMTAVIEADEARAQRAAWDIARENALGVLDRVMALIHREDKESPALAECQAKARELHVALARAPMPDELEQETALVGGRVRPFVELMTLADGWNRLDDERCAFLQDSITQSFGRQLGLAALRGKLGHEGEMLAVEPPRLAGPTAPPASIAPAAPPPPPTMAVPVAPAAAAGPGIVPADAPEPAPAIVLPPASAPPPPAVAPPGAPLVTQIRLSGERVQVETPEERREREDLLERLAADTAQWWIAARAGFEQLVERGLSPASAARDTLGKFPYLLSVPIQKSVEFQKGRLAEGYAILLQRLEQEEPGLVREALTRLNPQLNSRTLDDSYPIGQELYLYVVAEGRLYKTYPDFVRDVLSYVLPEPGLWVQGEILDADEATTILTRVAAPGGAAQDSRTLADPAERTAAHAFSVTTGPLTTRVFTVQAGELKDPTDVEIRLKEDDAASDHAWVVLVPTSGKPEAPKKHRVGGTAVPGLGKQYKAIWIAVFNSDPDHDRRYDLTVTLKRKAPPPAAPESKFAGAKASPFAAKKRP